MDNNFKVDTVNTDSKCWVVRSGVRYRYVSKFYEDGFVATGHLDDFAIDEEVLSKEINYENIDESIDGFNLINSRNVKTQIENFIIDMQIGDVVFTLDANYVIPGVIKSGVYYSLDDISDQEQFRVRRAVAWGDPIARRTIPLTIQRSFNAYQTIFSLGDNSKEIFHWLMSFFISGDDYFSSLRVDQPGELKHHTLKQLSELIDRIQVLSILIAEKYAENNNLQEEGYRVSYAELQDAMWRYSEEGLLDLTSQQILMSPGDVWLKFSNSSKVAGAIFLYLILTTSSPGKTIQFSEEVYGQELEKVMAIVDDNRDVLNHNLNIEKIKRQLILNAAKQNNQLVENEPTKNTGDGFPEDGEPRHVGG
ncbi:MULTISPECIES: hypothetical protein [unclassified Serratia (in: enterobacteria)]|uniref:hypothetical protein n=7 Tax=Serratia TaxID=613 RepID=UPI00117B08EC|nr:MULTISPECIES: hypothetical protein [unclassified Serratia (in: enterobacteria)]